VLTQLPLPAYAKAFPAACVVDSHHYFSYSGKPCLFSTIACLWASFCRPGQKSGKTRPEGFWGMREQRFS